LIYAYQINQFRVIHSILLKLTSDFGLAVLQVDLNQLKV